MQLLYNSFFLPEYMDEKSITQTIDLTLENRFLSIDNRAYEVTTLPKAELITLQTVILKIEEQNCDILFFLDYLLLDEHFTLTQLLHVYLTISLEYRNLVGYLILSQRPLLSESGKELIRTQSWRRLHEVDFDLTYEIAESPIFGVLFTEFITIVSPTSY